MTGEKRAPSAAPAQPGGRAPAPGQLALVQAFINSHYSLEHDHGADLWSSPRALQKWLIARGLVSADARIGTAELHRALVAREALRALATRDRPADSRREHLDGLNSACEGAAVELRFDAGGPRFVRGSGGTFADALGLILGLTAAAMIGGGWARMKVCPGAHCGWAFYDASRNQTGRWCSMSVCGGRAKAQAHYRRRRAVP
jgi:predicted RNA-binding Zn ribbon-like protein